jgi:hypothetical protein
MRVSNPINHSCLRMTAIKASGPAVAQAGTTAAVHGSALKPEAATWTPGGKTETFVNRCRIDTKCRSVCQLIQDVDAGPPV